jgi:hypothetical protein
MLRQAIVFGICAALVAEAADPPWKTVGACLTPQGTLCRTLKLKSTGWENVSWGFHAVRRWSGSAVLAYSRNGPIMEQHTQQNYRNWIVRDTQWDHVQIKFPLEQRTIEIDHSSKEYQVRSGVRGGLPVWDSDDSDCAKMALAFSLSDLKREGETVIAGFRSIRYTGLRSKKEREHLWLAPSLGCTQMMVVTSAHNTFGLPTAYSRSEVVSVRLGEPDKALFAAPKGYRESR